ncbi:MAG: maltotransferase domain-containing protein [Oligoflexus sp.]
MADKKNATAPSRVIIDDIQPTVNQGLFSVKRCVGEVVDVKAVVICDGHDEICVRLKYWHESQQDSPHEVFLLNNGNDEWSGKFASIKIGKYYFSVESWVDRFNSWRKNSLKKLNADQLEKSDILEGLQQLKSIKDQLIKVSSERFYQDILNFLQQYVDQPQSLLELKQHLESATLIESFQKVIDPLSFQESPIYSVLVEPSIAGFSSWYEFFPRSLGSEEKRHGTLVDAKKHLQWVADMGFHVVYLPPIHPIGQSYRKGKNNNTRAKSDDVGSPWAIGDQSGGHKAIHSDLGTFDDFHEFVAEAKRLNLHIALDIAFQCSPDHPYVRKHPNWFYQRPDGSIHYAENPPKKYQDIYPINFESDDWQNLWEELKSVFLFWCDKGVRIFRVDNPHTKSFPFWQWCLEGIRSEYPDAVFLSEAFTRPHRMYWLAKSGFSQSYTYFTWRHSKHEIIEYMNELNKPPVSYVFRPNFWPNTPDILPSDLRDQQRPAFIKRLMLAATLSSNYGIYGPAFELCYSQGLNLSSEEYLDSEKYELKQWPKTLPPWHLGPVIKRLNQIRYQHPALQRTGNHIFLECHHDEMLSFLKYDDDSLDYLIVVINLSSHQTNSCHFHLPHGTIPVPPGSPIEAHDLISDEVVSWHGDRHYIEINPQLMPAKIFHIYNIQQPLTDEL